jgi:hypothetical protein
VGATPTTTTNIMTNKKQVREQLEYLDRCILEGDLKIMIKNLEAFSTKYPNHTDFYIDVTENYDDPDDFILYGYRDETDDERAKRLIREAKYRAKREVAKERAKKAAITAKKHKEAAQRAQYEKLKKIYGSVTET